MRTAININAVATVANLNDRVLVIAGMVAHSLQRLGQQLLWLTASIAKPSLRLGVKHSRSIYSSECMGSQTSGYLKFGTGDGPTGLLGYQPRTATVIQAS